MSIKNDSLYPLYQLYLESKGVTGGKLSLALISNSMFNDFVYRFETSSTFRSGLEKLNLSVKRDDAIKEILDEVDDFEIFLDDLNLTTSKNSLDIDDDIFDF